MSWPETPSGGRLGDGRFADATERPETVESLRQVVVDRAGNGHALYPQGGGTALDYGGIPRRPGVAVDLRALDRVIDYPAADMTITVEAGMTLARLGEVLAGSNQRLLVDAPHPDRATLGGIYATNTSGPRRFGAGRPRDQIIGVSFVAADGALVKGGGRVVKNVAGYDFPKLLTGSLGTLGIIIQLTLKVRPRPEASAIVWSGFKSIAQLGEALDRLNTSDTRPIAVELLSPVAASLLGEPMGLPRGSWVLAVGFEDNTAAVAWQIERLRTELGSVRTEIREGLEAGPLWKALTEFQAAEMGPITVVVNILPSAVLAFAGRLDPGRWVVQSHAGNGIVRAHLVGEIEIGEVAPEIERLRAEAVRGGGNLILSRCPTAWKEQLRVWGEPRPDWAISERIKRALDPEGVLNPGRFVGTI